MPRLTPFCLLGLLASVTCAGPPPLHQVIDEKIAAGWKSRKVTPAAQTSDAEFLRRVTLDLTGTLPTSAQARAFLDDRAADQRARLVDRLLASPEHARHMQLLFDVFLQERQYANYITDKEWEEYLHRSFASNKPWDQHVRELLGATGRDAATRPAMRFYLARTTDSYRVLQYDKIVRDIGRLFLGVNLQCAQCHDHPHVGDYSQADYHGLKAFVHRLHVAADPEPAGKGRMLIDEKKEGTTRFASVFVSKKKGELQTGPRLPGAKELPESTLDRQGQLARLLPSAANAHFTRNSANRFWDLMLGRGLVHPLDLHHSGNPPSHPELLATLAERFAADRFNVRNLLREIALSRTYQLSGAKSDPAAFASAPLRPLRPHTLALAVMQATGFTDAERLALGGSPAEPALFAKLSPNMVPFVTLYGKPAGQPDVNLDVSLFQALFLANGDPVRGWLQPRAGNLMDRLGKQKDVPALAEELYLSVYTRRPAADETAAVAEHLRDRKDRAEALQELIWAMLASSEFRFNH